MKNKRKLRSYLKGKTQLGLSEVIESLENTDNLDVFIDCWNSCIDDRVDSGQFELVLEKIDNMVQSDQNHKSFQSREKLLFEDAMKPETRNVA